MIRLTKSSYEEDTPLRAKRAKVLRKLARLIYMQESPMNPFLSERMVYKDLKKQYKEAKANGFT